MLVQSSNLHSVDYDGSAATLTVVFQSGGCYQYFQVPDSEFSNLVGASSVGSYFHAHIKNRYGWRKVY